MVKLEVNDPQRKHVVFYFASMEDCEAFKHVFQDHMCNVPWMKPIVAEQFPEMTDNDRDMLDMDPIKRAESDLNWGFYLVSRLGIQFTVKQAERLNAIADIINSGCTIMSDKRCDMSVTCGMHYDEYWRAVHVDHIMSQDYFNCWLNRNCAKCIYMSDVCMHDEATEHKDSTDKEDDLATPGNPTTGTTQTTTSQMNPGSTVDQAKLEILIDIAMVASTLSKHGLDRLPEVAKCVYEYVYRASNGGADKTEVRLALDTFGFIGPNNAPFALVYLWTMIMTDYGTVLRPKSFVGYITDIDAVMMLTKAISDFNKEETDGKK